MFKKPDGGRRNAYAYVPFGSGIRKCPGENIAMKEVVILIANAVMMLPEYDIVPEKFLDHLEYSFSLNTPQLFEVIIK